jgi:hypothetical protein
VKTATGWEGYQNGTLVSTVNDAFSNVVTISMWQGTSGHTMQFDSVSTGTVPEPSALVLLSVGLISLLAYAWRKRR